MITLVATGRIVPLQPIIVNVPSGDEAPPNKTVYMLPTYTEQQQRVVLPGLTGSNIRGALRNEGGLPALAEVYGATPGDPSTFGVLTPDQVFNASSGGLVAKGAERAVDLVEAKGNRGRDLHSSLFGSMRLRMKGLLEVDFALPDPEAASSGRVLGRHFGARKDAYRQEPGLLLRHTEAEIEAFQERLGANKDLSALRGQVKKLERERGTIRKARGEIKEEQKLRLAAIEVELAEFKRRTDALQATGAESIGRTLDGVDYIPAGLALNHEWRIVNASDATVGYALQCFRHFSLNCRLGARGNTGFGRVRMEYTLRVRDRGTWKLRDAGRLVIEPFNFDLDTDDPVLLRAMEAFEEARTRPGDHFDLTLGADQRKVEAPGEEA